MAANGVRSRSEVGRERAFAQLNCLRRRRLRRAWRSNPLIEGATINFEPHVARLVHAYLLREHDLDLDAVVPETGWMLSPRAVDRCLWAGYYGATGNSDHCNVARRVAAALRADVTFYAKIEKLELEQLDLPSAQRDLRYADR